MPDFQRIDGRLDRVEGRLTSVEVIVQDHSKILREHSADLGEIKQLVGGQMEVSAELKAASHTH